MITSSPSGVTILLCWRAGAPEEMNPTLRLSTPSSICFLIICTTTILHTKLDKEAT